MANAVSVASATPPAGLPLDVKTHPPTEERIARLRELQAEGMAAYQAA